MGSDSTCPVFGLLSLLGKKRVIMVLKSLREGNTTFTSIKDSIDGISANLLTERLNDLVGIGYAEKNIISTQPVKIEYQLTQKGKDLSSIIMQFVNFAGGICSDTKQVK